MSEKKKRMSNFSLKEEEILLKIVGNKRQVIENKKSDGFTWQEKSKAWDEISKIFEAVSGTKRPVKNLRDKYDNMKKKVKKKLAQERKQVFLTGGGSKPERKLDSNCKILLSLMGTSGVGPDNQFDNNAADVNISTAISNVDTVMFDEAEASSELALRVSGEEISSEYDKIANENQDQSLIENLLSWSPALLKSTKSPELASADKEKKQITPNLDASEYRKIFCIEEEKRAKERHEWQREEHIKKMELLNLQIKLIKQQSL